MNVQVEHLENHTARLTVTLDKDRFERAKQAAAKRIAAQVNIPGFRKGKAPYQIVLRYVGEGALLEEALDKLGNEVFLEALNESKVQPYAPASLENIKTDPEIVLTFVVPKRAEIDLGDYRAVRLPFEEPTVDDSAVEDELDRLRERHAQREAVERPAQMGDALKATVYADVVHPPHEDEHAHDEAGKDDEAEADASQSAPEAAAPEGAPQAEASVGDATPKAEVEQPTADDAADAEDEGDVDDDDDDGDDDIADRTESMIDGEELTFALRNEAGKDLVPGFSERLIGVTAGETREFTIEIPEDSGDKRFAAHTFKFQVSVTEVQARVLPDLNDDFAKQASEGKQETLLDLRVETQRKLQEEATRQALDQYKAAVMVEIVKGATVRYPQEMLDEFADEVLELLDQNLRQQNLSLTRLMQIQGKDKAAMRKDYYPQAINRLKRAMVMGEVIRSEKLAATSEAVDAYLEKMASQFSTDPAEIATFRRMFDQPQQRESIQNGLLSDMLGDRLADIGRGLPLSEPGAPQAETPPTPDQETASSGGEESAQ